MRPSRRIARFVGRAVVAASMAIALLFAGGLLMNAGGAGPEGLSGVNVPLLFAGWTILALVVWLWWLQRRGRPPAPGDDQPGGGEPPSPTDPSSRPRSQDRTPARL
jgi:hypothetical protein